MSVRSRSRSPHANRNSSEDKHQSFKERDEHKRIALLLENIPKSWTHLDVKEYIRAKTIPNDMTAKLRFVKILKSKPNSETGLCAAIFVTPKACDEAFAVLSGQSHEGVPINVKYDHGYIPRDKRKAMLEPPPQQLNSSWQGHETYGLNRGFLHSLKIKPPLENKVFVANLDIKVTESKLREVFGNAGVVLSVTLLHRKHQEEMRVMAKVEFDHPVEAVQAISMFHERDLYDRPMAVMMDHHKNSARQMPEGLKDFGPGLGRNGEPLRGVRNSVELLPFKQYLNHEIENLKMAQDSNKDNQNAPNQDAQKQSAQNQNAQNQNAPNQNAVNQNALSSLLALNSILNPTGLQQLQSLFSQGVSDPLATLGAFQNNAQNQLAAFQNQNPAFQAANVGFGQATDNGNPAFQNQTGYQANTSLQGQNAAYQSQNTDFQAQNPAFQGQITGFQGQNAAFQGQNAAFQGQNAAFQGQNAAFQGLNTGFQGQHAGFQNVVPQNQTAAFEGQNSGTNWGTQVTDSYKEGSSSNYSSYNQEEDLGGYRDNGDPSKLTTRDMLMFKNLPPSVTSSALLTKMREVGELKFAEMTGQGRAIVRFTHVEDAVRCIKLFDQSKVDGQKIDVRFF